MITTKGIIYQESMKEKITCITLNFLQLIGRVITKVTSKKMRDNKTQPSRISLAFPSMIIKKKNLNLIVGLITNLKGFRFHNYNHWWERGFFAYFSHETTDRWNLDLSST